MSWWDQVTGGLSSAWNDAGNWLSGTLGIGSGDPTNQDRNALRGVGQGAMGFAGQNQAQYGGDTAALQQERQQLLDLQSGKNSVSAEQLRQGLQQQLAQQRSMAASANPNDSAMAARNAAMNMGQASYGMAGQQALAGLAERNQATQALAGLDLGMRGQDITGTLGGYNSATGAYGSAIGNPQKTWGSTLMGGLGGAAQIAGMAASDKKIKTDVQDGGDRASKVLDGLKAYEFRFKKGGKGKKELGVMAQDVEKVMPHVVAQTPGGKMLDGAKLAAANTGMLAALHDRVKKLEKSGKTPGSGANDDDDDED